MIAIDHRQAPEPSYTIRSSSPRTILSACRGSAKAQAKIPFAVTASPVTDAALDSPRDTTLLTGHSDKNEIAPGVLQISASELSLALKRLSHTALPASSSMFPWLHCIRATNTEQRHFFRVDHQTGCPPPTMWRGISLVHCTSGLSEERRLIGSIEPRHILKAQASSDSTTYFADVDPQWGIHLRNFGLQQCKAALISDLVVYRVGNTEADKDCALALCKRLAEAQDRFRAQQGTEFPVYRTYLVSSDFDTFVSEYPSLVAEEEEPQGAPYESEFLRLEREQMHILAQASEVSQNLYMGDDQDWLEITASDGSNLNERPHFDIHIRCDDNATVPCLSSNTSLNCTPGQVQEVTFPSSNAFSTPSQQEIESIVRFCTWLYNQTHAINCTTQDLYPTDLDDIHIASGTSTPEASAENTFSCAVSRRTNYSDSDMVSAGPKKVLLTCRDGYTETTFLALAYIVYANCIPLEDAWLYLHNDKKRDFYAFSEDLMVLRILFPALIAASPHPAHQKSEVLAKRPEEWFEGQRNVGWSGVCDSVFSGSLPSRILDHLYLGNLQHANNVGMLRAIGATRVLSVGENPTAWNITDSSNERPDAHLYIHSLHDDGIDSLEPEIENCLEFIAEGLALGQKTLVHCRVGVSRSASVCIAEVVRRRRMSIEDAYLFTRARRLNVIIQPNLRFMYELVKWAQEELSRDSLKESGELVARTIEWPVLCDQIARLNRYYIQQK